MPEPTDITADLPGTRIRDIRLARGYTQEQLADRAGLSLAVVKKIEQGGNGPDGIAPAEDVVIESVK